MIPRPTVALVDYGAGNLHSLRKGLGAAGARVEVTRDWRRALALDGLVLPGVGAFGTAAAALPSDPSGVRAALEDGLPCLGICLGMQLLMEESEEAEGRGIGLVAGSVRRIRARVVPHMGWNDVEGIEGPLFEGCGALVAYYAHAYLCRPERPDEVVAWTTYDGVRFPAAVRRARTWGVQFHPEKSSSAGRRLLANWVRLAGEAA